MNEFWQWLVYSDEGLIVRISCGVGFFAGLAGWDIMRKGKSATRWREYVFLLAAVCVAMLYGIVNNQISAAVSWEYFYHGKDLQDVLGPQTPPALGTLHWEATKIGMMATWTVGLLLGVAVLFANNPRKTLPQLPYRTLYKLLGVPVIFAAVFGAIGGLSGYAGLLTNCAEDFRMIWDNNIFRPRLFMAAWGIHLGGYVGGPLGAALTITWLIRKRFKMRNINP